MSDVRAILDGISIIHLRMEIDRLCAENAELRSELDIFLKDTAKVRAVLMAASADEIGPPLHVPQPQ